MNTFDVVIRFADEADFGAIEALINANFPNDPPISKQTIASWLAVGGRVIVAVAPHQIIGCVRMDPEREGLFHLVVVPELRKNGLGARLVAELNLLPDSWVGRTSCLVLIHPRMSSFGTTEGWATS